MRNTITFCLALLLILTGCNPRQSQYRIGVSQCLDDAWRQKMNEEMERELLLHPELSISRRIAYGSNELQCAQIDSFIAERIDLLIVSPNETEAVKPAVSRAFRAGIPVIVADRRVTGNEWTSFIGGDNYRVGQLMADWLKNIQAEVHRPIQVLEVTGSQGSAPATLRHQGMKDGLDSLPSAVRKQIEIYSLTGNWYKEDAYIAVRGFLGTHKHIDAIVAHNDLMAIGSSEAVRDSKDYEAGSVRIMGVDGILLGLQAIMDGTIECSATYSSRGDMLIETAASILAKQPFVRDTVLETMMLDATSAFPLLKQYEARLHDLETLEIVQKQSESQWRKLQFDRVVLTICVMVFFLLFVMSLFVLVLKQRKIQKEIRRDILPQLEEVQEAIQLNHRDVAFAERMQQIVEDHLSDANLNVEFLSSALQLSRTQLFRRVKSITGKGPLEYIRERRLKRAHELLRTTDMTVQQVSLEMCFSSPGYFAKCYKSYYGKLPSSEVVIRA